MTDIYVKPVIDIYGSSLYLVRNNRAQDYFSVMLTRVELEEVIAKASEAMDNVDKFLLEHPYNER